MGNIKALILLAFLLPDTGCPIVDKKVEANIQTLFPGAIVTHPRREVLLIETNVSGQISPEFCRQLFNSFAVRPEFKDLEFGFSIAQYSVLGIGISDNLIIWDKRQKNQFWVVNRYQFEQPNWSSLVAPFPIEGTASAGTSQNSYSQRQDPRAALAGAVVGSVATMITKKMQKKHDQPPPPPASESPKQATVQTTARDTQQASPSDSQPKAIVICGDSVAPVPFTSDSRTARKTLNCGEQVIVLSRTGAWTRVRTRDGVEGYVSSKNLD
ncbi:MAG: SH3 domain-containing protein [Acidobacteria bacterium]|nr:SH3 domain-containing protein [Acidobacteriota bacterium]MCI0718132.1 SH3 domain-containing protein [Acidobacteriota bacterium]